MRCSTVRFPTGNGLHWIVGTTGFVPSVGHVSTMHLVNTVLQCAPRQDDMHACVRSTNSAGSMCRCNKHEPP